MGKLIVVSDLGMMATVVVGNGYDHHYDHYFSPFREHYFFRRDYYCCRCVYCARMNSQPRIILRGDEELSAELDAFFAIVVSSKTIIMQAL